jgi:hypothetical protein
MPGLRALASRSAFVGAAITVFTVAYFLFLVLIVRLVMVWLSTPRSERWSGWPLRDRWVKLLIVLDVLCSTAVAGLLVAAAATGAFGE